MSPTIRRKYKYFHSTVQRAKDRRQKFHFCGLTYDHVTSNLISLFSKVYFHELDNKMSCSFQLMKNALPRSLSTRDKIHIFIYSANMAKTKRNSKLISYAVNMASLSLYKTPLNIFSRNSVAKQLPAIICTNYTYFVEIATNE